MSPAGHGPGALQPTGKALAGLALGALGVVFGDIGTSPLYAVKETFSGPHAFPVTATNVMGVLSLIFWSLAFVIGVKYIGFVLRADNRGEGGILALLALVMRGGGRAEIRPGGRHPGPVRRGTALR